MISVIIPAYNAEKHIGLCLESLLRQTCTVFEVVLVDDGSTDETLRISKGYCDSFESLKIVSTSNNGPYFARRIGLGASSGENVLFLDSDDMLHPQAIEWLEWAKNVCNAEVLGFGMRRGPECNFMNDLCFDGSDIEIDVDLRRKIASGENVGLSAKLIKRSLIREDSNCAKANGMRYAEDWLQMLDVADECRLYCEAKQALYFYRDNYISETSRYRDGQVNDLDVTFSSLRKKTKKWGKKYEREACKAMCKHSFWLLMQISRLKEPGKKKNRKAKAVEMLLRKGCGADLDFAIKSMRLDFRVPLALLCSSRSRMSLSLTRLIYCINEKIALRRMG